MRWVVLIDHESTKKLTSGPIDYNKQTKCWDNSVHFSSYIQHLHKIDLVTIAWSHFFVPIQIFEYFVKF